MSLKLYNTLSRKKESFIPLHGKEVGMYTCGPTVYYYPHIGNMKAYVMWDVVKRSLKYLGYDVIHVMNITDVGHLTSDEDTGEDKMEKGAKRDGKTVWEVAEFYTNIFFENFKILNLKIPNIVCKATDYITEQIDLIKKLEEKGYTYVIKDGIYFDTEKFPEYGKIALLDKAGLQAGARVEMTAGKKSPTDFALWKFSYSKGRAFDIAQDNPAKKRQMEWESPWGLGFPGWHIECSAMSMKHLGETFDIHCGGIDHITVHHPNEIAQAECVTGKQFVKYWMHNNFILVEGKKMAKSAGTFYTIENLLEKGYSGREIRYLFISSHYRQEQNFTLKGLDQAGTTLESIDRFVQELEHYDDGSVDENLDTKLQEAKDSFTKNIEDDFNIPGSLTSVFDIQRYINPLIIQKKLSKDQAGTILQWLRNINEVLGIFRFDVNYEVPADVQILLLERQQARNNKNFSLSDELRGKIDALGYIVQDTPQGQKLEAK